MNSKALGPWLKSQWKQHYESAWAAFWATPPAAYVLPVISIALIVLTQSSPFAWVTEKPVQEIIAPVVLVMAAGTVLVGYHWFREKLPLMLSLLVWALFLHELHFEFMNGGILFALAGLSWWLSTARVELKDWLQDFWIRLWLAGAFMSYFISDMLDRHLFSFLPNYRSWNNNVEESLETCGHLMIFALVLAMVRVGQKIVMRQETSVKSS